MQKMRGGIFSDLTWAVIVSLQVTPSKAKIVSVLLADSPES